MLSGCTLNNDVHLCADDPAPTNAPSIPSQTLPTPTSGHDSPPPRLTHSRFIHLQNDDIRVSLTGAASYVIELKTRASPNLLIDQTHPYCYSMTPFQARLQLPHAEVTAIKYKRVPLSVCAVYIKPLLQR